MLNQREKIQLHKDICDNLHNLYIKKNNDYGDSVSDTYKKFGIESFLVRMYDKLNRLYALSRPEKECKIEDEKYTDTLADLANYAILAMIELYNEKSNLCCEAKEDDYPYTTGGELGAGKHSKED